MQQEKLALPIENVRLMLLLLQLQNNNNNNLQNKRKEKKRKEPMAVKCMFDAATKIAKNARLMLPTKKKEKKKEKKCQSLGQCTKSVI